MSENLPQQPGNGDEVDLGQLFNALGKLFDRLINFIASIFKSIFSIGIYTLKALLVNIKLIIGIMVIAAIAGFAIETTKPDVYSSKMLVRPYFDTKYQLIDNVEYFNALLSSQNYKTLSNIFSIEEEEAKEIKGFIVDVGPETENDQLVQFDIFKQTIDSSSAADISFDDFIENRSIYSNSLFQIIVESTKPDIFRSLEGGFNSSFANAYSLQKMAKRDSMISIQKANILASIEEVQKLQNIYINVLEDGSKENDPKFSLGDLSLSSEKTDTKEYDLLNQEIRLRGELRKLDEQKLQEDVFFDVISSFQQVGNITKSLKDRYSLIFPVLAFILLCLTYLGLKLAKYVKKYEG
jgi:hypothetical protein